MATAVDDSSRLLPTKRSRHRREFILAKTLLLRRSSPPVPRPGAPPSDEVPSHPCRSSSPAADQIPARVLHPRARCSVTSIFCLL
ncbi:hypothetical protein GQ55_3G395400 [Panicum hallii var. hallii]|uniref:Uncharacterized protein n=2 Tax=Panicum hallii TaxID=206008 RepID=A0A2T7EGN3_9POAL|nr:hypothetical protein PAHAL_3G414700 [Panicum hallii]PUZ66999.1 hypothetical protein GQ55_3G395400 [Panicum hallii var. hallii]